MEDAFFELKALLRKAEAPTVDELWAVIASSNAFTPVQCANDIAAAGLDAW